MFNIRSLLDVMYYYVMCNVIVYIFVFYCDNVRLYIYYVNITWFGFTCIVHVMGLFVVLFFTNVTMVFIYGWVIFAEKSVHSYNVIMIPDLRLVHH